MNGSPVLPPTVDLHCDSILFHLDRRRDLTVWSDEGHLDLPRMREGGLDAEVFAVFVHPATHAPGRRLLVARAGLAGLARLCEEAPGVVRALSPDELERGRAEGRLCAIPAVEGGHALDGDIGRLEELHALGARVLTLTWNNSNELGRSSMEPDGTGLTATGREAVRRLNALGMVADLSHAAPETFYDALEVSTVPVICSHSACRALRDFPRNLDDEQLR
ncbi:MAG TPA: membrane dipeptidase, partial [candidate division WOR-3 bacterium]|nr:membrane dipeptidase [candidate division WOR-3 bacterium]